jgi:hypothetical protein
MISQSYIIPGDDECAGHIWIFHRETQYRAMIKPQHMPACKSYDCVFCGAVKVEQHNLHIGYDEMEGEERLT